jgi:prepilin-type N-terminal cleavage/methylation domain-containing protein
MIRSGGEFRHGLTLMELLVVLVILAAIAGIVVAVVPNSSDDARVQVTRTNMTQLQAVILGGFKADMTEDIRRSQPTYQVLPRPGYFALNNSIPPNGPRPNKPQLRYLFRNPGPFGITMTQGLAETNSPSFDPATGHGWRGPYILPGIGKYPEPDAVNFTTDYGEKDDPTVLDGWGHPIVIIENALTGTAELRSAGKDGILGNADDIVLTLY